MSMEQAKMTDTPNKGVENEQTMPGLQCLIRVKTEIPVIKFGYEFFAQLITGLKESSTAVEWSLNMATSSMDEVVKYPMPYIKDHLLAVDQMLCASLDLTELNLPVVTKTPQELYEESVGYVARIVTPVIDWVEVECVPPADYYVENYLPELDPEQKIKPIDDGTGSKAHRLAEKLVRRVKQHAHAEPEYLGSLISKGYEESVAIVKKIIADPSLLSETFSHIWKKLGDGVTPEEVADSLLLVEMGCIKLRQGASSFVHLIEITKEMAIFFIDLFIRCVNKMIIHDVDKFSMTAIIEDKKSDAQALPLHEKIETTEEKTGSEEPSEKIAEPSTSSKTL